MPDESLFDKSKPTVMSKAAKASLANLTDHEILAQAGRNRFSGDMQTSFDPLAKVAKASKQIVAGQKYYHKPSKQEVEMMGAAHDGKVKVKLANGSRAKCSMDSLVAL